MATIIVNPYTDLGSGTANGTWSYVSNPTPAPTLPVTYNGNMTFDDTIHPFGVYVLKYTVTNAHLIGICTSTLVSHEATMTYNFQNTFPASNDECAGAITIPFPQSNTQPTSSLNRTNANSCPGAYYTVSANPPVLWGGNLAGDAWFRIPYTVPTVIPLHLTVLVNGVPFGTNGINNVKTALYRSTSGCPGDLLELENSTNQTSQLVISDVFNENCVFFLRVCSPIGDAGLFNIFLNI
jgi:hypothetical protein